MTTPNEHVEPPIESTTAPVEATAPAEPATARAESSATRAGYSRRRLIGTGVAGVGAGAVAGLVGGLALGRTAPSPEIRPGGNQRFADKVVLITGATSGIGRAAAIQYAAEGGQVGFCGRRENLGRDVERQIRAAGGEATYVRADVRDESQVQRFVDTVAERYGGIDVCFNNAGITVQKPLHEYTADEWDDVVGTNLRGVFLALKYQIPYLRRRGGGAVLVTSSSNAISTSGGKAAYAASKRALVGLVQSAAHDYAAENIRINTLLPGTTKTDFVRRLAGAADLPDVAWDVMAAQFGKSSVPGVGRLATAEEVAAFAVALTSGDFPYATGAQMVLDGGKTAYAG
ncbi:SDR family NAD(P)-dependent oxidoreductase [Micromonospora sp. NPDC003197]